MTTVSTWRISSQGEGPKQSIALICVYPSVDVNCSGFSWVFSGQEGVYGNVALSQPCQICTGILHDASSYHRWVWSGLMDYSTATVTSTSTRRYEELPGEPCKPACPVMSLKGISSCWQKLQCFMTGHSGCICQRCADPCGCRPFCMSGGLPALSFLLSVWPTRPKSMLQCTQSAAHSHRLKS